MSNKERKTAGQIMRERFFEIKKNRKLSPEIKEILEIHKKEVLMKKKAYRITKLPRQLNSVK
jgi:hypothetical protein